MPIIVNTAAMLLGFTLISTSLNKRTDDFRSEVNTLRSGMNGRFDLVGKLFTRHLRRVEDILGWPPQAPGTTVKWHFPNQYHPKKSR